MRASLVLALALGALGATGCASREAAGPRTVADTVDLRLVDTAGQVHDVDATLRRGGAVALVVWQTWCTSCAREAPAIAEARRAHGDAIAFLGVVPGRDDVVDEAEVERTRAAWGYEFPQVRDRDLALSRALGVDGTPTIIVLGPGRAVRYQAHRPPEDWTTLRGAPGAAAPPTPSAACPDGVCPLPPDGAPAAPRQ